MVYFTFSRVVAPQVPEYLAFRVPVGQVPSPLLPPFAYFRLRSFFGVSVVTFWPLFIFIPCVLTFCSPLVILHYLFFLRRHLRDCRGNVGLGVSVFKLGRAARSRALLVLGPAAPCCSS